MPKHTIVVRCDQGKTMKTSKPSGMFRPFENLKSLLEDQSFSITASSDQHPDNRFKYGSNPEPELEIPSALKIEDETKLFLEAMSDVRPISRKNRIQPHTRGSLPSVLEEKHPDTEALRKLQRLVKYGKGFVVADTPEYIEGSGYGANREVIRRLHRGDFSIQAHLDLHGLNVPQAEEAFDLFLKDAITTGKRAVLVVHGRGLSSPSKPVLKTRVLEWLTYGPWRKWIIAFSSARLCDGGAGATYLLLRQRPITKSQKKKKKASRCRRQQKRDPHIEIKKLDSDK